MTPDIGQLSLHRWVVCGSAAYHVPVQGPARFREVELAVRVVVCPFIRSPAFRRPAVAYYLRKEIEGDHESGIHRPHVRVSAIMEGPVDARQIAQGASTARRSGFRFHYLGGIEDHPDLAPGRAATEWRWAMRAVTDIALDFHCGPATALRSHQIELARLRDGWGGLRERLEPYLMRKSPRYQRIHDAGTGDRFWASIAIEYPPADPRPAWRCLFRTVIGIDYDWRRVIDELGLD